MESRVEPEPISPHFPLLLYSFRIIILMLPICIATNSSVHYSKVSPLMIPSKIKTCIMAVNKCSRIPVKKWRDRLKINIWNFIFRHNLDINFIWHAIIVCLENYFALLTLFLRNVKYVCSITRLLHVTILCSSSPSPFPFFPLQIHVIKIKLCYNFS